MSLTVVIDVVNAVTICQKKKFGQIIENNSYTVIIQTEQLIEVNFAFQNSNYFKETRSELLNT